MSVQTLLTLSGSKNYLSIPRRSADLDNTSQLQESPRKNLYNRGTKLRFLSESPVQGVVKKKKQAQLGVPHSRMQVELD